MKVNLTINIPAQLNDANSGETAQLALQLKRVVTDLNLILKNLDEDNFSSGFLKRIGGVINETAQT